MKTITRIVLLLAALPAILIASPQAAKCNTNSDDKAELLKVREAVWRAWFDDDTGTLRQLVPAETIVMSGGEKDWKKQTDIFRSADEFHAAGGKLTRLEFPRTAIQRYGDVAIIWSSFVVETETKGQREVSSGRATEIFVKRDGQWTNPGWHTDSDK